MKESILNGKRILAVDDEPDVLTVLEEEILEASPDCKFDKATGYKEAVQKMVSWTYDLVILDIMSVRGLDLLDFAVIRKYPVAILTVHSLIPEALKRSIPKETWAYLPREKLGEISLLLEDILKYGYSSGRKHLFETLEGFFSIRWSDYWQKSAVKFWCERCRCRHESVRPCIYGEIAKYQV